MMKKRLTSVALLLVWQCQLILGRPGVVDSPEIRKRAISTQFSSYNSIGTSDSSEKPVFETTESPTPISDFEPMKITHEDVVMGSNSVYGSHSPFMNGGIIFAIGQNSAQALAQPQPVLLQYLTPEGTPRQTAVQYVQILRPLMVVPPQPYLPARSVPMEMQTESPIITTKPTVNPFASYSNTYGTIIGAHSAPLTSYVPSSERTESDLDLNLNEYLPAASSRIAASYLAATPQVTAMSGFKPSTKLNMISQRA